MLDHVGYPVSDYLRSKDFYSKALAPLGCRLLMEITNEQTGGDGDHAGFGDEHPDFWIGTGKPQATNTHVAFTAKSRAEVDAFHAAALAAGGTDNGAPGLRPHYHATYYAAFVLDPDGNNVEAVCHDPA
ncbi:VOC family protein [Tabrizicola sp.]|uniref:VOC family protein n=1 Tax=Tabrizicola sp. TaxID=2005166 RepID=UPI003F3BA6F1